MGLFNPQKGSILIDGEPIYDYDEKNYRNLFGVVPQDSLLSHLTIKEKYSVFKRKNINEKTWQGVEIAYANEFVEKLPLKYNTLIGEKV